MTIVHHRYHDTRRSPVVLYQLAGDYADSSGNGHPALTLTGTEYWVDVFGYRAFFFNGASYFTAAANAALRITGALTIEAIATFNSLATRRTLVYHGVPGSAASGDNVLYAMNLETTNGVRAFQESGAGVFASATFAGVAMLAFVPYHLALRRTAAGAWDCLINGEVTDAPVALGVPDGGANGVLRIGGGEASSLFLGWMCSVQIVDRWLTDLEVLEDATWTGFAGMPSATVLGRRHGISHGPNFSPMLNPPRDGNALAVGPYPGRQRRIRRR